MKNKAYKKLWLNDKIEKKFYKSNKDEIRNSKNKDWNWKIINKEDICAL